MLVAIEKLCAPKQHSISPDRYHHAFTRIYPRPRWLHRFYRPCKQSGNELLASWQICGRSYRSWTYSILMKKKKKNFRWTLVAKITLNRANKKTRLICWNPSNKRFQWDKQVIWMDIIWGLTRLTIYLSKALMLEKLENTVWNVPWMIWHAFTGQNNRSSGILW